MQTQALINNLVKLFPVLALAAADLGSGQMSWEVYINFSEYRRRFELPERAAYSYLARPADAGQNQARVTLAQQLRSGTAELGENGILRPVDARPLQGSLDYAQHLLQRAADENDTQAQRILKKARPAD